MSQNKNRKTIFSTLVRSIYALDKLDGEFVASLCRGIPFVPGRDEWPTSGVLAWIPAKQVRAAKRTVKHAKGQIVKHRRHFAHLVQENRVDSTYDDDYDDTHVAFMRLQVLQSDYETAKTRLSELLAA